MARPTIRFLDDSLIEQIVSEATRVLCTLGVNIHNKTVLSILSDHGASADMGKLHVLFTEEIIERALKTAPSSFRL